MWGCLVCGAVSSPEPGRWPEEGLDRSSGYSTVPLSPAGSPCPEWTPLPARHVDSVDKLG